MRRLLFVLSVSVLTFGILSACSTNEESSDGESEAAGIDLLASLPPAEYQSIVWYRPADYSSSSFVNNFRQKTGPVITLATQMLGFNPANATEAFGLPAEHCTYFALFQKDETIIVLMETPLSADEVKEVMTEEKGFSFSTGNSKGYEYFIDSDVEEGFIHSNGWIAVGDTAILESIIEQSTSETGGYAHPLLRDIRARSSSVGFHTRPLADLDKGNFASQISRYAEDQETVNQLTAAADAIHTYSGAINLGDDVSGVIRAHFANGEDAKAFEDFLAVNGDSIRAQLAARGVRQVDEVKMFLPGLNVTEAELIAILESFSFSSEGEVLAVTIDLPWATVSPLFEGEADDEEVE